MGLFSNVSGFVEKKLKQREERNAEEKEIRDIEHKQIIEERKKQAPIFAAARVKIEMGQKLKAVKEGKGQTGGFKLNMPAIQNLAHGVGQSTENAFNRDFEAMMGGGSRGSAAPRSAGRSAPAPQARNGFGAEYESMFGGGSKKHETKESYKKERKEHKKGRDRIIIVRG